MMENLEKRREKEVGPTGEEEGGDSYLTVNRWGQQETLALLNIRSQMDGLFRHSVLKAPLWDDVSRRMTELGYDRSAKKCKEKFKNIYKYHKRLKNCSYGRSDGKHYRFFDQLESLEQHHILFPTSVTKQGETAMKDDTDLGINPNEVPLFAMPLSSYSTPNTTSTPSFSSSGSESEDDRKKKRKWEEFSEKLMRCVLRKQEDLQKKFLEALDKFERERIAREEEWKMQEMARIKREHELLMQERSLSAAKDAAILAFLQKLSDQGKRADDAQGPTEENPAFPMHAVQGKMQENPSQDMRIICINEKDSGENSSSRWPKQEVEDLIMIRSKLDIEYERSGAKGPSWQDVSTAMKTIGHDRNAKRCKEKWENINKYYRRVKDSNKERPIDSKTCSYFHLLDDLYCKKTEKLDNSSDTSVGNLKPEEILMHMMSRYSGRDQQIQQEHAVLQLERGELISDHTQIPIVNDTETVANAQIGT